jgi:Uma2 family endonuclease
VIHPPRHTSADLDLLPNIEGVRYEIIDGKLHVSKQPHAFHQFACSQIVIDLGQWDRQAGIGMTLIAPGLIFSEDVDVVPDLVWISRARLQQVIDDAGHLRAAPELVIEVLSPGAENERRDRDLKLRVYSRQGVQEYWIVDWRLHTVQVYRREAAMLQLVATLRDGDRLESPLLPGFSGSVSGLWTS